MEEMQHYYTATSHKHNAIEIRNLTAMWDVVEKTNVSQNQLLVDGWFKKLNSISLQYNLIKTLNFFNKIYFGFEIDIIVVI